MSFPPYERDKDFKKPLSIRPNGHQIKVCSQCEEEFMIIGSGDLCMSCYGEQTCEECGVAQYEEELLESNYGYMFCADCFHYKCGFCGERVEEEGDFCCEDCVKGYKWDNFREKC